MVEDNVHLLTVGRSFDLFWDVLGVMVDYRICAEFPRFLQFIGRHLIPRRTVSGLPEQMGGRRAYLALIQEEHRRICQAIERRDPRGAREAMRRHLTRSLERYRRLAAQRNAA